MTRPNTIHPPPRYSRATPRKVWERLTWPQVAALFLMLAGLAGVAHALPPAFWDKIDWQVVVSGLSTLLGLIISTLSGKLVLPAHDEGGQ